jgi:hypothetical protein
MFVKLLSTFLIDTITGVMEWSQTSLFQKSSSATYSVIQKSVSFLSLSCCQEVDQSINSAYHSSYNLVKNYSQLSMNFSLPPDCKLN